MIRIEIVQPDPQLAQRYARWLREAGYSVAISPLAILDVAEGIASCIAVGDLEGDADVIVLDPWLPAGGPELNSEPLVASIRRQRSCQPIVFAGQNRITPVWVAQLGGRDPRVGIAFPATRESLLAAVAGVLPNRIPVKAG